MNVYVGLGGTVGGGGKIGVNIAGNGGSGGAGGNGGEGIGGNASGGSAKSGIYNTYGGLALNNLIFSHNLAVGGSVTGGLGRGANGSSGSEGGSGGNAAAKVDVSVGLGGNAGIAVNLGANVGGNGSSGGSGSYRCRWCSADSSSGCIGRSDQDRRRLRPHRR